MVIDGNISGEVLKEGRRAAMLLINPSVPSHGGGAFLSWQGTDAPDCQDPIGWREREASEIISQSDLVEFWIRAGDLTALRFCRRQVIDSSPVGNR